jgi:hypothetical protein|tara:strand:+ start:830 stop:1141 length:312 start_codon:yes stop_codon:yes gene_type:complete
MATFFHNITTTLTKDLLTPADKINSVSSITIANVHASGTAAVDLFLNKGTDNFYILKGVEIPHGTTLLLGSEDIPSFNGYSMRAQVDNGDGSAAIPVDIMIKR